MTGITELIKYNLELNGIKGSSLITPIEQMIQADNTISYNNQSYSITKGIELISNNFSHLKEVNKTIKVKPKIETNPESESIQRIMKKPFKDWSYPERVKIHKWDKDTYYRYEEIE
jgi:hypothetical protein